MDIIKEKEELIEMFGIYFESLHKLPPLASRILGILILDCCKFGMTFENLVDRLGASKSSVSTNLNLLLKLDKIRYYTLSGDRKKYFKPAPFSDRLQNYLKMLESEKELLDRLLSYREKNISCTEEMYAYENSKAYQFHILEMEALLIKTIDKFKKIETNQ